MPTQLEKVHWIVFLTFVEVNVLFVLVVAALYA